MKSGDFCDAAYIELYIFIYSIIIIMDIIIQAVSS